MNVQSHGKRFCTLNAEVNAASFDAGDSGLRDATELRELALTEVLKLTNDTHRFAR